MTPSSTGQSVTAVQEQGSGRVDKPWGYELRWAITPLYVGKLIHIDAGKRLSLQYHVEKDESLFIVSGTLDLLLQNEQGVDEVHRLTAGMSARVLPGRRHRFMAVEDVDLLEVSSPQIDDVVRLEDDFGREGTSAP